MRSSRVALLVGACVAAGAACSEGGGGAPPSDAAADGGTKAACVDRSFAPLVAASSVVTVATGGNDVVYVVSMASSSADAVSSVYRVSKDGGPATKIADTVGQVPFVGVSAGIATWARNVALLGGVDLYLEWRALDGSTGGTTHMPAGWGFDYMTVGPDGAYVGVRSVPDTSPLNGIYVFRRDGTYAQLVQVPAAGDMFVNGTDLWYLTERLHGTLVQRSLVDGQEKTIARELDAPLAADADHVFSHHGSATEIVGISKTSGALDVSIKLGGVVPFQPIALLEDEIVWSQAGVAADPFGSPAADPATATGLFRARRDGSCLTRLDPSNGYPFVGDGNAVYVAGPGGLFVLR